METKQTIIKFAINFPQEANIDNIESKIFDDLSLFNAFVQEYQYALDNNKYHF